MSVRNRSRPILGFTPEEWCADPTLWARQLHPANAEPTFDTEDGMLQGAVHSGAQEYRLRHRDGRDVWIRDDARLLEDGNGQCLWHGVMSDITERRQTEAELERSASQQAAVARLGEHALKGASASDLMHEALGAAAELLEVEIAVVAELTTRGDGRWLQVTHGNPRIPDTWPWPVSRSSQAGFTVLTGGPVIVIDWSRERRFRCSPALVKAGTRSGLTVMIEGRRGPFGVLGLYSKSLHEFKPGDIDFAQSLANVLGDTVERQLTDDDIRHRALHDPLTGLPNRTLFVDRLQQATRAAASPSRLADRGAGARSRSLQARQRQPRPPGGRRAAGRHGAAATSGHPLHRHRRPLRRRRVRDRPGGDRR